MQFNSPRFYPELYTERESNDENNRPTKSV